jgi:tetratricopeptide (TPR) repeat protein
VNRAVAAELLELAERAAASEGAARESLEAQLNERAEEVTAAVRHYLDADPESALRLTGVLSAFWEDTGRVEEGRLLTERALELAADEPSPSRARALLAASELAFRQGDQQPAEQLCQQAIEAGALANDERTVAFAHLNLARVAFRNEDAARMERHALDALNAAPSVAAVRRGAIHMRAWAAYTAGDIESAKQRFEESLELRRAVGDRLGVASEEANLADLAAEQGNLSESAARLSNALTTAHELGSSYLVLNVLPSIAALAARTGRDEDAVRLIGATDGMARSTGLVPDPGNWQSVLDEAVGRMSERANDVRAQGAAMEPTGAVQLAMQVAEAVARESTIDR